MKKIVVALLLCLVLGCSVAYASDSNELIYSDITVCINHYNIPSFAINGTSVVVVDDLPKYGINVEKSNYDGSLHLSVKQKAYVNPVKFDIDVNQTGKVAGVAIKDAVSVYIGPTKIDSYYLNGYTYVPVESLRYLGSVYWIPEQKALKLWIDGVKINSKFEPVPLNEASVIYQETVRDVAIYREAGVYDKAVSALNWSIDAVGEGSKYYNKLFNLREEMAYLDAMKNINICVKAGNIQNARYAASDYLYLCKEGSPYYEALVTKYCEYTFIEANNNIKIHLNKRDYLSAFTTASNAQNTLSYYLDVSDAEPYYDAMYEKKKSVCTTWKNRTGNNFIILNSYAYNGKVTMQVINLEGKEVKAFRFTGSVRNVFGDYVTNNHKSRNCTADVYIGAYESTTVTWDFGYKAEKITDIKNLQVVYY